MHDTNSGELRNSSPIRSPTPTPIAASARPTWLARASSSVVVSARSVPSIRTNRIAMRSGSSAASSEMRTPYGVPGVSSTF
jgi:hypothetical protein